MHFEYRIAKALQILVRYTHRRNMGISWSRRATTEDLMTAVKRCDIKRVRSLLEENESTPVDTAEDLQALGVTSPGEVCDVNGRPGD